MSGKSLILIFMLLLFLWTGCVPQDTPEETPKYFCGRAGYSGSDP